MKDKVNILFVCGYGVGSSLMLKTVVGKALDGFGIKSEMEHTAAGEASGYLEWADIVAISKMLVSMVDIDPSRGLHVIEIENLMDGEKIGGQIKEVVLEYYPDAIEV